MNGAASAQAARRGGRLGGALVLAALLCGLPPCDSEPTPCEQLASAICTWHFTCNTNADEIPEGGAANLADSCEEKMFVAEPVACAAEYDAALERPCVGDPGTTPECG